MTEKRLQHKEVVKPLSWKVGELVDALRLLRDAVQRVESGDHYHFPTISGQLRSILTDKKAGSPPLLIDVANQLGHKIIMFAMDDLLKNPFPVKTDFHVSMSTFSLEKVMMSQSELDIEDIMKGTYLIYNGENYSISDVIKFFANRAGGAHYAHTMPESFAAMLSFKVFDRTPLIDLLLNFARAVLLVGRHLINKLFSAEYHFLILVTEGERCGLTVYDAQYIDSPMRITIEVSIEGVIVARLISINGLGFEFRSKKIIDFSEPRHIRVTHSLSEDLFTEMCIDVDGYTVGKEVSKVPILVSNLLHGYKINFGKKHEEEYGRESFALSQVITLGGIMPTWEAANLMMYMEKRRVSPDDNVCLYEAGSYGMTVVGDSTLQMVGSVKLVPAKEAMPLWGADTAKHVSRPMGW